MKFLIATRVHRVDPCPQLHDEQRQVVLLRAILDACRVCDPCICAGARQRQACRQFGHLNEIGRECRAEARSHAARSVCCSRRNLICGHQGAAPSCYQLSRAEALASLLLSCASWSNVSFIAQFARLHNLRCSYTYIHTYIAPSKSSHFLYNGCFSCFTSPSSYCHKNHNDSPGPVNNPPIPSRTSLEYRLVPFARCPSDGPFDVSRS